MIDRATEWKIDDVPEPEAEPTEMPQVILPGGKTTITAAGRALGELLARAGYYARGESQEFAVVRDRSVEIIRPNLARSEFEKVARLFGWKFTKSDGWEVVPKACSKEDADGIIVSDGFKSQLPPINAITHCPVLLDDGTIVAGYHEPSGLYAFGDQPDDVPLDEAVEMLLDLQGDFAYVTENDRARDMAAMLTPAMVYGKHLGDNARCPIMNREASHSQSGKGTANNRDAAIYGTTPRCVGQRSGGVGSMEESLQTHFIAAVPWATLDNLRGKQNLPWLEMAATEKLVDCRVPHRGSVSVDPTRTVVTMTSNKSELTPDLANRCNIVRIEKQSEGYIFKAYPEGSIIDHVRANQSRYLGAVYAVLRRWIELGKPGEPDGRHDFRRWAGAVGWIVQEIFGLADPLVGHRELQLRTANTSSNWVRDLCIAVADDGKLNTELYSHHLFDILIDHEIEVPGVQTHDDPEDDKVRQKGFRGIGTRMGKLYKKLENVGDPLLVDAFEVERFTEPNPTDRSKIRHFYTVRRTADAPKI